MILTPESALFLACMITIASMSLLLIVMGMAAPEARGLIVAVVILLVVVLFILYWGYEPPKYRFRY